MSNERASLEEEVVYESPLKKDNYFSPTNRTENRITNSESVHVQRMKFIRIGDTKKMQMMHQHLAQLQSRNLSYASRRNMDCTFPPSPLYNTTIDDHHSEQTPLEKKPKYYYNQIVEVIFPQEWEHTFDNDYNTCKIISLSSYSQEYNQICQKVHESIPEAQISNIQRIQNPHLWRRYFLEREFIKQKNNGQPNELELFHGTSLRSPQEIFNSEEGFDLRFCVKGRWGIGCYFTDSARYATNYAYNDRSTNTSQILLSKVITGETFYTTQEHPTLRKPPPKPLGHRSSMNLTGELYDSVQGEHLGSKVTTIYSNAKAYPAYVISIYST